MSPEDSLFPSSFVVIVCYIFQFACSPALSRFRFYVVVFPHSVLAQKGSDLVQNFLFFSIFFVPASHLYYNSIPICQHHSLLYFSFCIGSTLCLFTGWTSFLLLLFYLAIFPWVCGLFARPLLGENKKKINQHMLYPNIVAMYVKVVVRCVASLEKP